MDQRPPVTDRSAATGSPSQVQIASGLNIIAGIWLIISPFVLRFSQMNTIRNDDIIVGIIVAVLAAIRAFGAYQAAWLSWINLLLGIWVFISAFIFTSMATPMPFWNSIILGIIVFILGGWSALSSPSGLARRPV